MIGEAVNNTADALKQRTVISSIVVLGYAMKNDLSSDEFLSRELSANFQ